MSLISMTGFGSGSAAVNGNQVYAEISTINRKQLEIRFSLPREFAPFEHELRKLLQSKLSRGMVSVRMSKNVSGSAAAGINRERVKALIAAAQELGSEFGVDGKLTMAQVLTMPGVFDDSEGATQVEEDVRSAAFTALDNALNALNNMRCAEGRALAQELEQRLRILEELHARLLPFTSGIEEQIKARLLEKLAAADLPVDLQDERLLKELLYYADKSDVTEELTRLSSHFAQFRNFLNDTPGGGRSMDFLMQEMFREITTLGNKAGSGEVAEIVVKFKTELEKIREQIQNIE
ncbi:MAG: YicC family protein [Lentisphaerae bacterium]|nr:YicC family protein [Lentisphaerota bacterium]